MLVFEETARAKKSEQFSDTAAFLVSRGPTSSPMPPQHDSQQQRGGGDGHDRRNCSGGRGHGCRRGRRQSGGNFRANQAHQERWNSCAPSQIQQHLGLLPGQVNNSPPTSNIGPFSNSSSPYLYLQNSRLEPLIVLLPLPIPN